MNLKLQTSHHHQPEAQGSVHPWCSLLWTGPHLLRITLYIDPPYNSQTIQPPHPRNHLVSSSPPETTLLLMEYSTLSDYCSPTTPPLMHYLLCLFCSCIYLGIIAVHLSVLILNVNRYRYLASTFPTSPTALPCSTPLSGEPHNALHSPSTD